MQIIKKQYNFTNLIIPILTLLTLVVGGYVLLLPFLKVKSTTDIFQVTQPSQTISFIEENEPTTPTTESIKVKEGQTIYAGQIYENNEVGYSLIVPNGWVLKTMDENPYLIPLECVQFYLEVLKGYESCTIIDLPKYITARGWGYGNNYQEFENVELRDGNKAERGSFYYDDSVLVSWVYSFAESKIIPTPYTGILAFAHYFKARPQSHSLADIYKIVENINFSQ